MENIVTRLVVADVFPVVIEKTGVVHVHLDGKEKSAMVNIRTILFILKNH